MARIIEMFECETCGARYSTYDEAAACERRHTVFVSEIFAMYDTPLEDDEYNERVPDKLRVTFANGTSATYHRAGRHKTKPTEKDRERNIYEERNIY